MGSVRMDEGAKAAAARVATSSRRSLWRWRIRPPFLQLSPCSRVKGAEQPSQCLGKHSYLPIANSATYQRIESIGPRSVWVYKELSRQRSNRRLQQNQPSQRTGKLWDLAKTNSRSSRLLRTAMNCIQQLRQIAMNCVECWCKHGPGTQRLIFVEVNNDRLLIRGSTAFQSYQRN